MEVCSVSLVLPVTARRVLRMLGFSGLFLLTYDSKQDQHTTI